ncbi:DUF4091 domain-containing protein [Chitinophaga sp. GbtcB8]|uniref:DUF4091 domain-containing protein n=1 Tax=Chitinophaga sp. GbtcB8 TaxID=2824753 RepID=UPI001C3056B7|nr:DUF4091 domain-containing protein [Chitinophaga sp. GbtcB8]
MKVQGLILSAVVLITSCCKAQSPESKFETFGDISNITAPDQRKWQQQREDVKLSVADFNNRINYNRNPVTNIDAEVDVEGWRGEWVNCLLVVSSKTDIHSVKVNVSDLTSASGASIDQKSCKVGYVYYVLSDNSRGICQKKNVKLDDIIVPDIIDFTAGTSFVKGFTNRPIWISIAVPGNATPGTYKGKVNVSLDGKTAATDIVLKVSNNTLPPLANRNYFLDLWQYPVAEADYYKTKPWTDQHFNLMKRSLIQLRDAGQKVITTSFFWDVFNPAVRSADDMMIKVTKTKSGQWTYDFTNFDKWVQFMMGLGIKQQITCFGIAPLNYRYYYYDEGAGKVTYFSQGVNGNDYKQFWTPYLKAFEQHLKEKGWFNITTLGIDEKEMSVLTALIDFIKSQDKDWKISLTGKYFPEIQDKIYNYSVISNQQIPADVMAQRKAKGYITTFYTSCWELFPNTFVMSDPIDATWLGWNAANRSMDGYLRWAFDYWSKGKNALIDTRSGISSGDNFLIYPSGYSSVRFEMLKDGIEDYEKIGQKSGNNLAAGAARFAGTARSAAAAPAGIKQLKTRLSDFDFKKVSANRSRGLQIQEARGLLDN